MLETWNKLMQDEEFVKAINSCEDEAAVLALLKENGIEVSSLDELKKVVLPKSTELDVDELEKVSGGGFCIGVGVGADMLACWKEGSGYVGNEGYGAYACVFLGVGAGSVWCGTEGRV